GYDAANTCTATVAWGDGTAPTAGAIDGTDGVFRVTGGHAYAADGVYTATVTVTDADGTTAATTSTVVVGDVLAGQSATLTVSSFTSGNSNAPPYSFMATIGWGDGGWSMGTVSGSNGVYTVAGSHAYGAAGTYTVQAT